MPFDPRQLPAAKSKNAIDAQIGVPLNMAHAWAETPKGREKYLKVIEKASEWSHMRVHNDIQQKREWIAEYKRREVRQKVLEPEVVEAGLKYSKIYEEYHAASASAHGPVFNNILMNQILNWIRRNENELMSNHWRQIKEEKVQGIYAAVCVCALWTTARVLTAMCIHPQIS